MLEQEVKAHVDMTYLIGESTSSEVTKRHLQFLVLTFNIDFDGDHRIKMGGHWRRSHDEDDRLLI